MKVKFNIPLEYVAGRLRYGHFEGTIELTEDEFKRLEKNPMDFIYEEDLLCNLDLIMDSYRIDDWGPPSEVNYEVIKSEKER